MALYFILCRALSGFARIALPRDVKNLEPLRYIRFPLIVVLSLLGNLFPWEMDGV